MREAMRGVWAALGSLVVAVQLGGCPTNTSPLEFVAGGTGEATILRSTPEVNVLTPVSDLSVSGGTQVEVNWRAFARTRTSVINVIVDQDQDPNNGNEIVAFSNLSLTTTTALVDTTTLKNGTYFVGVVLVEVGNIAAFGYAPGRITVDQRPTLFFNEPTDSTKVSVRGNLAFDRTPTSIPRFQVSWTLNDPDSTDVVDVYLDPDDQPNGNEVLLFHSTSQTTDSFTFDLPTTEFAAGTYRILALVTDGLNKFPFYAPGQILLRSRLAGFYDLRDLAAGTGGLSGAVFEGFNPRDNAGSFVHATGDLDGDGFTDFIILSQFAKPRYVVNTQRTGIGEAYLVYGRAKRFSGVVNLNSTGTLFRGEIYLGVPEVPDPIRPSRGITSFAVLSDWDNDGVREMAFGCPFTDSVSVGGFAFSTSGLNLAPLDSNGYFRTGAVVVAAGSSLRPDLGFPGGNLIGLAELGTLAHEAITAAPCPEGFYGPKAPTSFTNSGEGGSESTFFHRHLVSVTGVADRLGCRFCSADFGDQFGETVSAWDFDSIIMSAPNRDPSVSITGLSHAVPGAGVISVFYDDVVSGFYPWENTNAPPANAAVGYPGSSASAGTNLIPHGGPYHYVMDDLRFSPGYNVDPDDQDNPCEFIVAADIETPAVSVRFWSNLPGARLSNAIGLGDTNDDGLLDLAIGAPLAADGAGAVYIILGRQRDLLRGGQLPARRAGPADEQLQPQCTAGLRRHSDRWEPRRAAGPDPGQRRRLQPRWLRQRRDRLAPPEQSAAAGPRCSSARAMPST